MRAFVLVLAASVAACGGDDEANQLVVDALVMTTERIDDAIDADPTLLIPSDDGAAVSGSIEDAGGTLLFAGWRDGGDHDGVDGYYASYAERLVVEYQGWSEAGLVMTGSFVLSRHSIDYGTTEDAITEVSRTSAFYGRFAATGDANGTFDVDVHGFASGTVQWTCGTVNGDPVGSGACY